jgi:putative acetyltransferase
LTRHVDQDELVIGAEDPHSPDARLLIARLSAELGALYGDDGSGAFTPDDVCVPGGAFVIARLSGRAIGCGALRPMESGVGEIKRMFVEPAFRGRGVARRILAELETAARTAGYKRLRLETGVRQPAAVRLYESAGYRRIPYYGRYVHEPLSVCFEKLLP